MNDLVRRLLEATREANVTSEPRGEDLLELLRLEPTLLDPAPRAITADVTDKRTQDEVHTCLRCGVRAKVAMVVESAIGPRWLDLCPDDYSWLIRTMDPDMP